MARDFVFNQHGAISDASANTITAFSLVGWFRWDGNQHSTTLISGTDATGPTVTWSHALRMNGSDLFQAYAFDGTVRSMNGTTAATAGTWYHVAMTAANGAAMKLYVNGALEATSGFTLGTLTTVLDRWRIGGGTSGTLFWSGDIAEVALFRSVLSAGDISSLAAGTASPLDVGAPRWYFPLCGTGTETDLSANGLTLTWPVSTPTGSAHPIGIANGCGFALPIVGSFGIGADMTVQGATRAISFNVTNVAQVDTTPNQFTVHGPMLFDGDVTITGALTGGSGLSDGDKGDITVSSGGAAWAIDNDAVSYAKIQNVSAASKLLGRGDSGSGDVQEITLGTGLSMAGTTLSASGGGGGAGQLVQSVSTQTGSVSTGTTQIPIDDTIPQNSEGDEYMSLSITPTSATNKLRIDVAFNGATPNTSSTYLTVALFQDSTANALAAVARMNEAALSLMEINLSHYMTAGTTSATTFKVRAGANASGTTTFNGRNAGRLFGGVMASSITIMEIVP